MEYPEAVQTRYAIVTGASRGIGKAIASALLEEGIHVAACSRTAPPTTQPNLISQATDVTDPASVADFFAYVDQHFPALDILVNNAGIGIFHPTADLSLEDWHTTLATNLNAPFYFSREALPRFRKRGGGYIFNIGSLAGKNAFAGGAAYNASKFGLNGFSEAMFLDHRQENIRVTEILPGSVSTTFGHSAEADWKIAPEDIAQIVIDLLAIPARTLISRVEVRPSRPALNKASQ